MNGILLMKGPQVRRGARVDGIRIFDLAGHILYRMGLRIPEDFDSRIAPEVYEPGTLDADPPRTMPVSEIKSSGPGKELSPDEIARMKENLRKLGYVDWARPAPRARAALARSRGACAERTSVAGVPSQSGTAPSRVDWIQRASGPAGPAKAGGPTTHLRRPGLKRREERLHLLREHRRIERLLEEADAPVPADVGRHVLGGEAAREEHADGGTDATELDERLVSVHVRHRHVEHDGGDLVLASAERLDRLAPVRGRGSPGSRDAAT